MASFPRNLAIPQLPRSNVLAIVPLVMRGPTTVFTHRGLSPHQFTPMSGAHQRSWSGRRASRFCLHLSASGPAPLTADVHDEHDSSSYPLGCRGECCVGASCAHQDRWTPQPDLVAFGDQPDSREDADTESPDPIERIQGRVDTTAPLWEVLGRDISIRPGDPNSHEVRKVAEARIRVLGDGGL